MIAGIDPGTTAGWAVITFSGELVAIGSQKELNRDKLLSELVRVGRILVVGSDKAKVPSFVKEVAVKIGARVINPNEDMLVEEKRALTHNYKFANTHQMDALAGALLAYRKLQPLLLKIRSFLAKEQKENLFFKVAELVVKEGISIKSALAILEPPKKEEKIEFKEVFTNKFGVTSSHGAEERKEEDVVTLFSTIQKLRRDNEILRKHNQILERRAQQAEEKLQNLENKSAQLVKPQKPVEAVKQKNKQLIAMSQRLEHNKQEEQHLIRKINELERLWLEGYTAILKLNTLSWKEIKEKEKFIHQNSVLFVENVNSMSTQALQWLEKKEIAFVITGMPAGKNAKQVLPFRCFTINDYKLFVHLAAVRKTTLDKLRTEKELLSKMIEDYKSNRALDVQRQ